MYINIEEIGILISQLIKANKIQIKNINNNENIKLFFNITNLFGSEEIILEKKKLLGPFLNNINILIKIFNRI